MALPDALAWMKSEIFLEDLSVVGNADLNNDWYCTFYEDEELDEQHLLEDFRKCEIWEEFIRGFYLDYLDGFETIEYLLRNDAEFMGEDEWWAFHKLAIREEGAESDLQNLSGTSFEINNVRVNVLDAWFGVGKKSTFWEDWIEFTILCEIDGKETSFIGELSDLNYCPVRKDLESCSYCAEYYDMQFFPGPDTFSEWLRLTIESKQSD